MATANIFIFEKYDVQMYLKHVHRKRETMYRNNKESKLEIRTDASACNCVNCIFKKNKKNALCDLWNNRLLCAQLNIHSYSHNLQLN